MSRYKFKGYTITNCGYHQPDHCVWWEAVNDNGEACFHGNTLREVEFMILDYEWEQKIRKKDEEIEKLKREKIEVESDALEVGGIVEATRTAEKSSAVSNAAAMREALELASCVSDLCCSVEYDPLEECHRYCCSYQDVQGQERVAGNKCPWKKIRAALSAPARNIEQLAAPTDSNGNTIHVADKVHMLNTDSRGDHEWDDEVYSLEFIGSGGGDKWLIHGHKGAAWACECTVITTAPTSNAQAQMTHEAQEGGAK